MLQAFDDANPNISIEIVTIPKNADGTDGNYSDYLNTLASQQNLPDVYQWTSVPDLVAKDWAYDASAYAFDDEDYNNVVESMREGGTLNGKVYGIPQAMYLMGMAINYDIFDELNVEPLEYSYTLDDLANAIAAVSTDKYRGSDWLEIERWGALTQSDTIGFGTFDGEKYNFSSPEFAKSIEIVKNIVAKKQTGNGGYITESWLPEGVGWAWGEG